MKITYIDRHDIEYTETIYEDSLYESVQRIFLSFPIKVSMSDGKYVCTDGHKRLTILEELKSEKKVPCIVQEDLRSTGLWTPMNSH